MVILNGVYCFFLLYFFFIFKGSLLRILLRFNKIKKCILYKVKYVVFVFLFVQVNFSVSFRVLIKFGEIDYELVYFLGLFMNCECNGKE